MGRVSKYSGVFRRQAAMLVVDGGRGVRDVARKLDVNHETLRNWVGALKWSRATPGRPGSGDERAELARLRRRVAELEFERDLEKGRGALQRVADELNTRPRRSLDWDTPAERLAALMDAS